MYTITFIANCGFLLNYGKDTLLLDGLFELPFEKEEGADGHLVPDQKVLAQIMKREGIFSDVTRLLFTHTHWDHCSRRLTEEYVRSAGIPAIFPEEGAAPFFYEDSAIRIEAIPTLHDRMTNYDQTPHWCYRMTIDDEVLLFTGDLDVHQEIPEALYEKPVDILFFNVHHLLIPQGRNAATSFLKPSRIFVQHMPDPAHDIFNLRKRIVNKLNVYGDTLPPCTLLTEPMTQILTGGTK